MTSEEYKQEILNSNNVSQGAKLAIKMLANMCKMLNIAEIYILKTYINQRMKEK